MEFNKTISLGNATASRKKLFDKDIWQAEQIGLEPDRVHSAYRLNFTRIQPGWLRLAAKQFIYFYSSIKSYNTCHSYIVALQRFSQFLLQVNEQIQPHEIERHHIVDYFAYLNTAKLSLSTRQIFIVHLRTFLETASQENWLDVTNKRLIFYTDIPKPHEAIPKYIPEAVLAQLMQHLPSLSVYLQRFIFILHETGRRIGEICTLPVNCLVTDDQGDYFLDIKERKLKKQYLIPITKKCARVLQAQQADALKDDSNANSGITYLFQTRRSNSQSQHISARYINHRLNKLAKEKEITDDIGQIWHFHSHQFRHTVGTRMINAGVPQHLVQKYLGHESPSMTSRYAHIHDHTLKRVFESFQATQTNLQTTSSKLVDVTGRQVEQMDEAAWLKHNLMSQALPNGICGLPVVLQRCPHANACLTCTHFRTDKRFLFQHQQQLDQTRTILAEAKKQGWQRMIEINESVETHLNKIITALEEES